MGDVLLALLTILVLVGAGVAVARQNDPPAASSFTPSAAGQTSEPVADPSSSAKPSATVSSTTGPVVLAGPDLAKMRSALSTDTGAAVLVASDKGPDVLAAGSLSGISATPRAVVLQVLAGSRTSVRTTEAITAVHKKWPGVRVLVVGPFSSADRKSAAAVQSAAKLASVSFLDPVALHWRPVDTSAVLTQADVGLVEHQLAAELH